MRPSSGTRRPAAAQGPAIKTDIEQLLPISHGVRSLPRPPRLPTFDAPPAMVSATRRFPWASLGVFAVVIAASATTLYQYTDMRGEPSTLVPAQPETGASDRGVPVISVASTSEDRRDAVERIERTFAGNLARVSEALLDEAERALSANDERLAEALFARAYELDQDVARATYGLARVRVAQGNLEGAEGWILAAIREQPSNAAFHALYANVLERWGRLQEAQLERSITRSLARAHEP